jgi:plasmid stabilization system protein ParE
MHDPKIRALERNQERSQRQRNRNQGSRGSWPEMGSECALDGCANPCATSTPRSLTSRPTTRRARLSVPRVRAAVATLIDQSALGRPAHLPEMRERVVCESRSIVPCSVRGETVGILHIVHAS